MEFIIGVYRVRLKVLFLVTCIISLFLTGCDQRESATLPSETGQQRNAVCVVCNALASYVERIFSDLGKSHPFSIAVEEYYLEIINEGEDTHRFLTNSASLQIMGENDHCEGKLISGLDERLLNIETQAEKIANQQQRCNQLCPQYNCGEYVDFLGMNQALLELLTILEGRFIDAALSSGEVLELVPSNTQRYQVQLKPILQKGIKLVEKAHLVIENEKGRVLKDSLEDQSQYPLWQQLREQFTDQALQLENMAQTTAVLQWSIPLSQSSVFVLSERLAGLAANSRKLAYQYEQSFAMADGGKADAAIQRGLARISLLQLGHYHKLLSDLDEINAQLRGDSGDEALACYENKAVNVGVTKELYAIAADAVSQCAQQQQCKTQAGLSFDAISQNQQTVKSLLEKLDSVHGVLDKVVYSYTSASCN